MYFQLRDSRVRVQVTDTRPLDEHRAEYRRHVTGLLVYADAAREVASRREFLGFTQGPQPRPYEYIELTGTVVAPDGTPSGPSITFRRKDAAHVCLYRAWVDGARHDLWGPTARCALSEHGRWLCATVDNDGRIHQDGAVIGSLALVG